VAASCTGFPSTVLAAATDTATARADDVWSVSRRLTIAAWAAASDAFCISSRASRTYARSNPSAANPMITAKQIAISTAIAPASALLPRR
jgi:hypothetical protein